MNKFMPKTSTSSYISVALYSTTLLLALVLSSSIVSADNNEVIDSVQLTIPVACTMSGTGTTHTATLNPGTYSGASGSEYENGIGKTTLTTFCNDNNGFAIYAIGFTGDVYEGANHTKLIGQNTNETITTKAYASGDTTSNWSMKVTKVDNPVSGDPITYNPNNMSIQNSFNSWHVVPDTYTKVADYHSSTTDPSTTDTTLGAKLETTYATYISTTQPADTYSGQVKYTMVHPYNNEPHDGPIANCPANKICYSPVANDIEGTMGQQSITSSATSATLLASNYSRTGYGFAGWSDVYDYNTNSNAHFYGPQEDITFTAGQYSTTNGGLRLYAVWVPSQGSLQNSTKVTELCGTGDNALTTAPTDGTADLSSVSALTDQRDNQTYAIAKLADGNCWMIENLRLEAEYTRTAEEQTLSQGYATSTTYGDFIGLANAESSNFANLDTANSIYYSGSQSGTASIDVGTTYSSAYRIPRYNNDNTLARASNPTDNTTAIYSYGNYYTWSAAIASTIYYNGPTSTDANGKTSETANKSICPSGWRLPYGRTTGRGISSGGFSFLDTQLGGTGTATSSETTPTGAIMSAAWRSFPNNFLFTGYYDDSSVINRGSNSRYWSSTSRDETTAYRLYFNKNNNYPGSASSGKRYGNTMRCLVDS